MCWLKVSRLRFLIISGNVLNTPSFLFGIGQWWPTELLICLHCCILLLPFITLQHRINKRQSHSYSVCLASYCLQLQHTHGCPQQSTPRWGKPWGTSFPATCSAQWPAAAEPVNTKTPLAGAMRSKPWKDSTRPGRFCRTAASLGFFSSLKKK